MNHSIKITRLTLLFVFLLTLALSACNRTPGNGQEPAAVEPTATAVPQKTLTICVGSEPESLYMYANSTQSMWSILEGIYDGPIDTVNYQPEPVILANIPSQENGGVTVQSAAVVKGDLVANSEGDVVALAKGVKVFPEGCTSNGCIVEWDGVSELKVSQMVVKFTLLPGITWSDGQPLTAADSVYSFNVAADTATEVSKTAIKKTQSYEALDAQTVQWTGLPGYLTVNPAAYFFTPLPEHQLSAYTAEQLKTAAETTRSPMGWGPYMISEWASGDSITMVKNPNYFRAAEGLPYFDAVTFKFIGNIPVTDLSLITTGECDIIDTSVAMTDQWLAIHTAEENGQLKSYVGQGPEWEGLNFGIKPNSYDDVFNPYLDRADFFGDVRTRQAIASCIDRDAVIKKWINSSGDVPVSYLTSSHPFHVDGLTSFLYDVEKGKQLLDEVGWKDLDNDPSTPRTSSGVSTVVDATEFVITYVATDTVLHANIASYLQEDLKECGITMNTDLMPADELYAAGPDGVLFGRNFDLAEIGWATGSQPSCFLYSSSEIPTAANGWNGTKYGGLNLTGYSNPAYDSACSTQLSSGLDKDGMLAANTEAMQLLANDLPVLPLYYDIKIMVSRPDLCGLTLDTTSRSGLRGIEALDVGEQCPAN
jgi:peptide/nickel transport system substrate-binding protein